MTPFPFPGGRTKRVREGERLQVETLRHRYVEKKHFGKERRPSPGEKSGHREGKYLHALVSSSVVTFLQVAPRRLRLERGRRGSRSCVVVVLLFGEDG